jgi:AmmeMemoRadiSam system protein A
MSTEEKKVGVDLGLSPDEKQILRDLARTTIENTSKGAEIASVSTASEKLNGRYGAFVTIYKKGMLRGCIGSLEPSGPLHKTVAEMAKAAACRDPRFRPVSADELQYIELEISVLTPLKEIKDPEEIVVGLHGLVVSKGHRSGLLLPQVAAERGWGRVTFLEETCRKAGLPKDAWMEKDARILIFSADIF